jgi:CcmD family protein
MLEYGKIFVVVAVLATILVGIFIYIFSIDKKIGKLEKEIKAESNQKEK